MQLIPSATSSNLIISDKDPVYVNLKLSLKEIDQLIRSRGETIAQLKDVAQKDELGARSFSTSHLFHPGDNYLTLAWHISIRASIDGFSQSTS